MADRTDEILGAISALGVRLERLEGKVDGISAKVDGLGAKVDVLDLKLTAVARKLLSPHECREVGITVGSVFGSNSAAAPVALAAKTR